MVDRGISMGKTYYQIIAFYDGTRGYGGNSDFWSSGPEVILLYEESISVDILITLIDFDG
jgi:hypothetical protein